MPDIQILGLRELEKKMIELGPKISRQALKGALIAGAREVRKEAIALAPVKTGRIRKAMYIKSMTKPNPFRENVLFGVRHGKKMSKRDLDAFYWTFQEFGTKFVKAIHFVEQAFERSKERALAKFKDALAINISRMVKGY